MRTLSIRTGNRLALLLTLLAFALRLSYAVTSHPFIDEFTSILAARQILRYGWPILPSGLFYEHGLVFSYLDAPFVALAMANQPINYLLARLPSLAIGTALVPLLYWLGRRWFSPGVGLLAALLLTFSPEAITWAGRARMYALTQLLVLALIFLAYQSSHYRAKPPLRWLTLLTLAIALLTQLATLLFIGPLIVAMLTNKWLTTPPEKRKLLSLTTLPFSLWEGIGLAGVVGLGLLVKRLGQPLGAPTLGSQGNSNPVLELWGTVAYQMQATFNVAETISFLGKQFGPPHNFWLGITALLGLGIFLLLLAQQGTTPSQNLPYLFILLIFGLTLIETFTLLAPFRRNPRYQVMSLPMLYLIVGGGFKHLDHLLSPLSAHRSFLPAVLLFAFLCLHGGGLWVDLNITYRTPEPAYEEAFAYVAAQRRPGEAVLTMNPSAAALHLVPVDYFAMQDQADQFLLNRTTDPVDRWLGSPWLGSGPALAGVLNDYPQTWFIIDTIRLPVYYRGDWQAILAGQMELVWANDEALVYRTAAERRPLASQPEVIRPAMLDRQVQLLGYADQVEAPNGQTEGIYRLTLFWSPLQPLPFDYTVFVHIRDGAGAVVAQRDAQPLAGRYPTSQWQAGETIIDLHQITLPTDLPAGQYQVWIGLYRLDTLERLPVDDDVSGENAILLGDLLLP